MATRDAIVVRYQGGELDEVVGSGCDVHLEDLGGCWMLIVEKGGQHVHLTIPYPNRWKGNKAFVLESWGKIRTTRDGKEVADGEA